MSTPIPWTDATWNPVTGCTKTSPGCANCYIERTPPFRMAGRKFVNGTTGVQLHPERLDKPLHWRKPRRIFVCSLADLFHEDVPDKFIFDVFLTMAKAPQHTFQVLTKRPERARDWFASFREIKSSEPWEQDATWLRLTGTPIAGWPLPNLWLGVTIENARFNYRADILREIPAAVRFISAEPLLWSLVDLPPGGFRFPLDLTGIDWLIAGAESGPKARPMDEDWVRELRDACGAECLDESPESTAGIATGKHCGPRPGFLYRDHRHPAFFYKQQIVNGRKVECPELDGRQWMEFPR